MTFNITLVGGPTALIEIGGLRILTDPTFDEPQTYSVPGVGSVSKTAGPAFSPQQISPVDIVLASHEHVDNLDISGREFVRTSALTYTTADVARQFGDDVRGLTENESVTVPVPDGGELTITATTAQHGPDGVHEAAGPVIGFLLSGEDLPTVYISGDNSSADVIRDIQDAYGTIDIAVLFTGGPIVPLLGDGAYLTLSNELALEVAQTVLTEATIVPIHTDSWSHFTQTADQIQALFDSHGLTDRIVTLHPGDSAEIPVARSVQAN